MVPGYTIEESEMSRNGTSFRGADGGNIKSYGQVLLNLIAPDSDGDGHDITSKSEVADVTQALWSVGLITDSGLKVFFIKTTAHVRDPERQGAMRVPSHERPVHSRRGNQESAA